MIYFSRPTSRRFSGFNAIRPLILLLALVYPSAGVRAQTAGEVAPPAKPTTFTIDGITTTVTPSTISVKLGAEAGKTVLISSKMKLLVRQNLPCVEVEVNGQPAVFMIDTGAGVNVVSRQAAERFGLKSGTTTEMRRGLGGDVDGVVEAPIETLKIGGFVFRGQQADVDDLQDFSGFDGTLGMPVIKLQAMTLDFENEVLEMTRDGYFVPSREDAALPLEITENDSLSIRLGLGDKSGIFEFDTGNANSIFFYAPFVEKNKLREIYKTHSISGTLAVLGGTIRGTSARIPKLKIGDFELVQVVGDFLGERQEIEEEAAGNVGSRIWERFTLTIDYKNKKLYVRPNASFNDPFDAPQFGVETDENSKITGVAPNSPAQEAGIIVGDTLVDMRGLTLAEREALPNLPTPRAGGVEGKGDGKERSTIIVKLRGADGKEREVVVTLRDLI